MSDFALDYAVRLAQSLNSTLRYHNYDSLIAIAKTKGVEPKGKDCQSFSEYRQRYSLYDAEVNLSRSRGVYSMIVMQIMDMLLPFWGWMRMSQE